MGIKEDIIEVSDFLKEELIENSQKREKIEGLFQKYEIKSTIGEYYNNNFDKGIKENGVVYTPGNIVDYMCSKLFRDYSLREILKMKICDPSCGTGNFIMGIIKYINNRISIEVSEEERYETFKAFLKENIYGYDIDGIAIKTLQIGCYRKYGNTIEHIFEGDFLFERNDKFDIIIGNPPYIGHKSMKKEYKAKLKERYWVFENKGDISYCFLAEGIHSLNEGGRLSFITSRYFIESLSGKKLRDDLIDSGVNMEIIDFFGIRPFKGIGIDPAIITVEKDKNVSESFTIKKPKIIEGEIIKDFFESICSDDENHQKFNVLKKRLQDKEKWILVDEIAQRIIDKIRKSSSYKLDETVEFYQGIITGCDRAFIIEEDEAIGFEEYLMKPWIKSSNINREWISKTTKRIIYSDIITEEHVRDSEAIKHIERYKDRLEGRRECKKGLRAWYKLQWGRKQLFFEEEKIIFPYKSTSNRFALDSGSYFSADVYGMKIKNESISYERLVKLLNTEIYEFYMKVLCKKLGKDLYEYYPNSLKHVAILDYVLGSGEISDDKIYNTLGLSQEEVKIVQNMCKR